jgi:hypothetical protein
MSISDVRVVGGFFFLNTSASIHPTTKLTPYGNRADIIVH